MSAYIFDGVEYPSVTTILGILDKPALIGWAAGLAVDWCINHREQINHPSFVPNDNESGVNMTGTTFSASTPA